MFEIEILNQNLGKIKRPKHFEQWVKVRDTMFVHTRGKNPGLILTSRRPNEDPEIQKYRLAIYEPITKGSMNRAIDKLYRIFGSANFSIQVSEELSTYLDQKKFSGQFFYSYIQKYVVRRMIEDPNGFLVWIPEGEGLVDSSQKVEVKPVIVNSDEIYYLSDDAITWEAEDEHSMIREYGRLVEKGEVYYTLTKTELWRHEQIGTKSDKSFQLTLVYTHNIGSVPAIVMGGDYTDDGYFESYFSAFVPFGNEAIRQYSDWQGVMTTSCFPYREEQAESCSAPGCRDGFCWNSEREENVACGICKGTGRVITRSPFGVFLREKGNSILDGGQSGPSDPMIRFIGPPVDVIQYSGNAWETLLKKAEEALHLNTIDESQSGTAKMIDREDSFMVLTKISNNIFDEIIYKSLQFIEKYRNVSDPMDPLIIKPISFSMKTEEDLINEINQLTDKNAPVAFLVETTKDLAKKRFSGNKSISRMVEILVSYDPIYHINSKDKQVLLASGIIKKDDIIKSLYSYKMLMKMVTDKGNTYLENQLSTIFADLDRELQPIINSYVGGNVIELAGGQAVDLNSEVQQKEAEAKANLKGSVGGVQGIIAIQQSVARGTTDRSSAIALLMEIYGFDLPTSEKMVGTPTLEPII
jgi:hypothetical protein